MTSLPDITSLTADDIGLIREMSKVAWDVIPSKLKKDAKDFAGSAWANIIWAQKAEVYLSALHARVGTTRLLGHPKELRIGDIFTDVYIYDRPLSAKRTVPTGVDGAALRAKRLFDEEHRLPAASILDERRIYLTGKPGAGKTTLLRHLILQSISSKPKITPIYIALKDIVENTKEGAEISLWAHIVAQFKVCQFPSTSDFVEKLFESGRATLMLDGLDEVTERNSLRYSLISQILSITGTYQKLRVIITCRVGADTYTFEKFAVAQIADFAPKQQIEFVKRWYGSDPAALQSFVEHWAEPQNAGLRDLASTPLLLALLCIGYDETREFPLRRGDMYKEAVEALLRRWSVSRGIVRDNPYRKLTSSRKEQMLAFMAYRLFKAGHFLFTSQTACNIISSFISSLPKREVDDNLEAVEVLRNLEAAHGLIIHETADYLAFSHLTIHEYFTARYLIDSSNERALRSELTFETISNRQWREVILLAIGSATTAEYLLSIVRSEIIRTLASEPNLRRILRLLSESDNPPAADVWGSWTDSLHGANATGGPGAAKSQLETMHGYSLRQLTGGLVQAMLGASFSPKITRRAHHFSVNVCGPHARYIDSFLRDAPETRRAKFLDVVYAEELYAQALAIGTLSDRIAFEEKAFTYE